VIETAAVAEGRDGLRLYRLEAEATNVSTATITFDPLAFLLDRYRTPTVDHVLERFSAQGSPVGPSSFRVACHVVSLPDLLLVVDSTFHATAAEIFPSALERLANEEGRSLGDRPLHVLYTHAHFDHAGGRAAVEALGDGVRTLAHPHTSALFPFVSRREAFFRTRDGFFRDCGIAKSLEEIGEEIRDLYFEMLERAAVRVDDHPFSAGDEEPLRVDELLEPEEGSIFLADGRVEVMRFDGHIPGHLCVLVDGEHLITGDMWLPATTSTVTPETIAARAGIPAGRCGILRYVESGQRLLGLAVDECASYPSHEHVFRNPKRMAMRDLELFGERIGLVNAVLREHHRRPMRVLDLAWGGKHGLPVWKLDGVKYRLLLAHDEATAYVHDLVRVGDLREVEPERYVWTGETALEAWLDAALREAREEYDHLEFRSRARGA